MNSIGRNNPNNNIEKALSGENMYHKKKINDGNVVDAENEKNNNNKSVIPTGHQSGSHKLKNSAIASSSPQKKEKLIRISEFKIEQTGNNPNHNKNDTKLPLNESKDLIKRLKNQASYLKSSITNKNKLIHNNKDKKDIIVNCFQIEDKENNKYIQNELSHCHLVKGINIINKHETFDMEHKKYYYGDKNKFNKNSYFFNEKNNNSNNVSNKNYNNKENDVLRKIKNLKTFHPGKINNKKSFSIKVNKDIDSNKIINTQNNNNNTKSNNENKDNESFLKEKNKLKVRQTNKSKDKIINKDKKINKVSSKEQLDILENKEKLEEKEKEKKEKIQIEKNQEKIIKKEKEKEKEKDKKQNNDDDIKNKNKEIKKEINDQQPHMDNTKNRKDYENKKDNEKENKDIKENHKTEKESRQITPKKIKKKEENKENKEPENIAYSEEEEEKVKYFDISNINNVQIPKDYINIIYYNLLEEENIELKPKPVYTYMKNQKEINDQMRSILIDWIIDVHHKFGFTDETLFMTVFIIDRYSSIEQITRIKYQCLGITALMIACKHEEINVPKVEDFIYITDNAYTKDEVFQMENDVLSKLNFSLLYPSPIKFYEYLSLHFNFSKKYHMLGKYLMESFLLDLNYIKYKPSIISCACTYIVMKFFKMSNYRQSYEKKFYLVDENVNTICNGFGVKDCAQDICLYVDNINNTNLLSCQKKYAKPEFESVSILISNNKS